MNDVTIIDKFLDYARPDHQTPERVSLKQVIEAAIYPASSDPNTTITTSIPPDTAVMGDATELQRVFANLLENARRYSDGPVTAELQREGVSAVLRVRDRGPGVPLDQRERIFEPFYRLPGASEREGGVGLGLALVKSITQRHNGHVRCEDQEGGGACFALSLPCHQL